MAQELHTHTFWLSAISNHINKNRLRVLQARQQILTELTQAGASQLIQINQDKEKYHALLKDLILQVGWRCGQQGLITWDIG